MQPSPIMARLTISREFGRQVRAPPREFLGQIRGVIKEPGHYWLARGRPSLGKMM
jgi:hypothetical protein